MLISAGGFAFYVYNHNRKIAELAKTESNRKKAEEESNRKKAEEENRPKQAINEMVSSDLVRVITKSYIDGFICFEFQNDSIKFFKLKPYVINNVEENIVEGIFSYESNNNLYKIFVGKILIKNNKLINEKDTCKYVDFRITKHRLEKYDLLGYCIEHKSMYDDGSSDEWYNDFLLLDFTDVKDINKLEKVIYFLKNITSYHNLTLLEKSYLENNQDILKNKQLIIKELDSDGNGVIDISENDDFSKLLKNKQSLIIEFEKAEGRPYIQNFIKLSKYLKEKGDNIQALFDILKNDSNITNDNYNDIVGVIKNQINTYNLILISGLNMIISLIEDDRVTFYEIYETFDKLNVFTTNHEREISDRLKNIENKIGDVIQSIHEMEMNICNELYDLQFISGEISDSISNLSKGLSDINSSIQTNNLLAGIQTYQMYKINKNFKSLN